MGKLGEQIGLEPCGVCVCVCVCVVCVCAHVPPPPSQATSLELMGQLDWTGWVGAGRVLLRPL